MKVTARAPGKLVLIGEYAVLTGAPALVAAVDRHCTVQIASRDADDCELRIRMQDEAVQRFACGAASGNAVVDSVVAAFPAREPIAWSATIDSSRLFDATVKLGLGSSAAALTAWAGAWCAFQRQSKPKLVELIKVYRHWRGGGSGIDIAASLRGGVNTYALNASGIGAASSAALPDGVAFVAISTGIPASTPALLAQFDRWRASDSAAATVMLERLSAIAASGIGAAAAGDARRFLAAIAAYGQGLSELGEAIGVNIVTREHLEIARIAERCGVAYKVSGAGGGDVGLAFAASRRDLDAFVAAAAPSGRPVSLGIDPDGLEITELSK